MVFLAQGAAGQPVMRIKAKLTAFDGQTMSLEPLSSAKEQTPILVSVTPKTRYVGSHQASFAAIKPGDYVGAAIIEDRDAKLRAQEVFSLCRSLARQRRRTFPRRRSVDGQRHR